MCFKLTPLCGCMKYLTWTTVTHDFIIPGRVIEAQEVGGGAEQTIKHFTEPMSRQRGITKVLGKCTAVGFICWWLIYSVVWVLWFVDYAVSRKALRPNCFGLNLEAQRRHDNHSNHQAFWKHCTVESDVWLTPSITLLIASYGQHSYSGQACLYCANHA